MSGIFVRARSLFGSNADQALPPDHLRMQTLSEKSETVSAGTVESMLPPDNDDVRSCSSVNVPNFVKPLNIPENDTKSVGSICLSSPAGSKTPILDAINEVISRPTRTRSNASALANLPPPYLAPGANRNSVSSEEEKAVADLKKYKLEDLLNMPGFSLSGEAVATQSYNKSRGF